MYGIDLSKRQLINSFYVYISLPESRCIFVKLKTVGSVALSASAGGLEGWWQFLFCEREGLAGAVFLH